MGKSALIRFVTIFLLLSSIAAAQQRDFSKVPIKVTHASGNIYMLEGAGGNIAASVGETVWSLLTINSHLSRKKPRLRSETL